MTLEKIIVQEQATHIRTIGIDNVVLYRPHLSYAQFLPIARVGCGIRGRKGFVETNDWFKIGTQTWRKCEDIPTWETRKI